ncbi:NUMOD1 domain-containing protein [bacterium A37T11]|nr:NUMOD1 domain-containing protein [bacterium A37T11]
MATKTYPYQNLSLKSMPGERWRPIYGLEEYFMVSNFGRVKRLEYVAIYDNGAVYPKPEKIIKPEIRQHHNHYKDDYSGYLAVRVGLEKSIYNFTIARLVYWVFKEDFDYYDYTKVIFYRDGDSFNIRPSNLYEATISQKQKRIKDLRRSPNPFHKLNSEEVKLRHWNMLKHHLKPIVQYSLDGKKIKTYNSIVEAHRATGANATGISRTAKGYHHSCGGFIWKYGEKKKYKKKGDL